MSQGESPTALQEVCRPDTWALSVVGMLQQPQRGGFDAVCIRPRHQGAPLAMRDEGRQKHRSCVLCVVPAYNEAGNIAAVIRDVRAHVPGGDVLVIDDGSADETADVALETGALVCRLPFNLGIGGAVQTGLKFAVRHGYDIAVQVDGDGQHDAAEIAKLLRPILNGEADVVIGSRFLGKVTYRPPLLRRLGMRLFELLNWLAAGQHIRDNTSGFRAYNREAISFLADNYPTHYPEPEAVVMLRRAGFRLKEVHTRMRQRQRGQSSIAPAKAVYYMVRVPLGIFITALRTVGMSRR